MAFSLSVSNAASAFPSIRRATASAATASSTLASAPAQAASTDRLVVARLDRLHDPAQSQKSVHGGRREPGLLSRLARRGGDRFERGAVDSRFDRGPVALDDERAETGPARQRLGEPGARFCFNPVEGRGHAQPDIEPLGVDAFELERPTPGAARFRRRGRIPSCCSRTSPQCLSSLGSRFGSGWSERSLRADQSAPPVGSY